MPPKPLVFVPGLPGSIIKEQAGDAELFPLPALVDMTADRRGKLSGPDDPNADDGIVAGDPVSNVIPGLKSSFIDFSGSLKLADSLYALLAGLGYTTQPFGQDFQPVGWDWRRPIDHSRAQADVRKAITALHDAAGERVVILCHSTGGLVVRSLLESAPDLVGRIERIIAVSVPWAGTLQPLPFLAGRQSIGFVSAADTQYVMDRSWAAFDLLPPDPARTVMTDAEGDLDFFTTSTGQASPLVATAWIPAEPSGFPMHARAARSDAQFGQRTRSPSLGDPPLDVVCFAGWGSDTLTGCRMDTQGNLAFTSSDEGDGTVARRSAAWLAGDNVRNFLVPVGHYPDSQITREHAALWLNPPVRDLLGELLAGRARPPYVYAAVDGDDADNYTPQVRVRMVALDAAGQPLPGAYALAFGLQGVDGATRYLIDDDGRGVMPVKRESITQDAGGGWFHFEVEIHWLEGGVDKSGPRQGLSVHKLG
jgi:hypothetical protein